MLNIVNKYIADRRVFGLKLSNVEWRLKLFAKFANSKGETHIVAKSAIDWASTAPSKASRHKRLEILIRFAKYVKQEDDRHEVPSNQAFPFKYQRPRPYIFSEEEIKAIICSAKNLSPANSLLPKTYSTLFALLAVTGLRISEALSLKISDLTSDGLLIREAKFHKSRIVPLHNTTSDALLDYIKIRQLFAPNDKHIFVSKWRKKLGRGVVTQTFQKVLRLSGVQKSTTGQGPNLHHLRHSFAVKALIQCEGNQDEVNRHMLALSTYMGHSRIECNYWYLESTPELMDKINRDVEEYFLGETR